ncbi:LON peptidase substrate-binding domain-containing protein [Phaeobacter sp. 11ANDIMAR09]|uniref:LON peptidase substrate-binding domain-containing protein n=1 Tax=Phaeobacter sp. 11ANDIMAR09 TaxID=1225647 RepID=UPI0006C83B51|nr:LON peptidase substrate-binding domain-containing protein [Phaeobacter sp. 11ANDIMAR09]KPD12115.1 ATP-dependent protease [Phaeobacter sp. 11ANDIMAR09]
MFHIAGLPDTLAVFPLPRAILLPRARLPLHIFEPRYLQMFEDVLKTPERLIGMIQPCATSPGEDALQAVGCAGRITQFSETEDGRYLVTLSGLSRFRVLGEVTGFSPYRRCDVSWTGFDRDLTSAGEVDPAFDRAGFLALLERFLTTQGLSTDWGSLKEAEDELLINSLSMMLEFDPEDKQALLEAPCLAKRRETLVTLIEFGLRGGAQEDILQ